MKKEKEFKLTEVKVINYGLVLSIKINNFAFRIIYDFYYNTFMLEVDCHISTAKGKAFEYFCNIFNLKIKPDDRGWYNDIALEYDDYLKIVSQLKSMGIKYKYGD
jgi:hypothetical protein